MAKIKKIQPKIDNLKNVYGNDKLGLNKAMMDLYKKENVKDIWIVGKRHFLRQKIKKKHN